MGCRAVNALPGTTGRRRIYLMRHGHVDYLETEVMRTRSFHEVALSPRGRMEALAAARAFANVALDRALCSGLPRTRETAELILEQLAAPPTLDIEPNLVEIQTGRPKEMLASRKDLGAIMAFQFARAAEEGATMLEGGEAFGAAQARAVAVLQSLLASPDWRQVLVVSHEGINRLILSWAAGAGLAATGAFEQDTGCINVLDFDMAPGHSGRPFPQIERVLIKAVNLTPYNYVKHGMNLTSLEAIFDRDFGQEKLDL